MTERTDPWQNPQSQETREPLTSTPSPYEAAFDAEIRTRFGSGLLEPFLDQYGKLIRLSSPVSINGKSVVFQYTRWDVEKRDSQLLGSAFREANPAPKTDANNVQRQENHDEEDEEATFIRNYSDRRAAAATIKERIELEGGHDPKRAVTDPEYYIPGAKIIQWPESFEFAIFNNDNNPSSENSEPSQLGRHGKVNGIRPDYLGVLNFGVEFEGVRGLVRTRESDDSFWLMCPRAYYEAIYAFEKVFYPEHESWLVPNEHGIEIDDMSHDPHWHIERSVYPNWISGTPEKVMGEIGTLVSHLTEPKS